VSNSTSESAPVMLWNACCVGVVNSTSSGSKILLFCLFLSLCSALDSVLLSSAVRILCSLGYAGSSATLAAGGPPYLGIGLLILRTRAGGTRSGSSLHSGGTAAAGFTTRKLAVPGLLFATVIGSTGIFPPIMLNVTAVSLFGRIRPTWFSAYILDRSVRGFLHSKELIMSSWTLCSRLSRRARLAARFLLASRICSLAILSW